ncbi:MAG: glycine cleavage system protein GcvH [Acidobacteriota bacterium]|nr:glycine cleavage system protein GcvH [Acidobacteriota bacterium]
MYPTDFRYTKEHEWVKLEGDVATVGITDYAQHELGDVVYVELPAARAKVEAGQAFGTVESVKSVSEIFSPVTGEVTEANGVLADHPETINQDAHGAAWLVRIRTSNAASEIASLMDAAAYEAYIAEQQKEASA